MVNQFGPLCRLTHQEDHHPISRAQLSLLLAKVNGALLAKLLFEWFGLLLTPAQQGWFALDGKDLRGSISKGKTRGEACVSVLNHESQQLIGQAYYSGDKDSEKLVIRQLLEDENLLSEQITLNTLHLNPLTVSAIHMTGGRYSIGLKANQPLLHR